MPTTSEYSIRHKLGTLVLDMPRWLRAMMPGNVEPSAIAPWVFFRNRHERIARGPSGRGARCEWEWTSELHLTNVFPPLGDWLMRRALGMWPIELRSAPSCPNADVEVSFIIGHAGIERLPHLVRTVESIAGQCGPKCECIVVEQSREPQARVVLPAWVRYLHTPPPFDSMPYCRSWSFNIGARSARGRLLVLHDNDMLVPSAYARELLSRFDEGYDVINLKRFIFYLGKAHSERILRSGGELFGEPPLQIVQNLAAGGSLAVGRDAYFALGGFDEAFVGWGNEDNEFWDRAASRRSWSFAYLPIVHLWHAPQPRKHDAVRDTANLYGARRAIPVSDRIRELAARPFGQAGQLSPAWAPRTGAFRVESA